MFFVGIMGIGNKEKMVAEMPNITCKACGGLGQYQVVKRYSYFHIFFIPLWKWQVSYYVKERMCQTVFILDREAGEAIEKGIQKEILPENIKETYPTRRCKKCGQVLEEKFVFCPYCCEEQDS